MDSLLEVANELGAGRLWAVAMVIGSLGMLDARMAWMMWTVFIMVLGIKAGFIS